MSPLKLVFLSVASLSVASLLVWKYLASGKTVSETTVDTVNNNMKAILQDESVQKAQNVVRDGYLMLEDNFKEADEETVLNNRVMDSLSDLYATWGFSP